MFKIGDKVRCVKPTSNFLQFGKIYTIEHIAQRLIYGVDFISVEGCIILWSESRFELLEREDYNWAKDGF